MAAILLFNYGISFAAITVLSVLCYGLFSLRATEWRTEFVRQVNAADSSSNTRAVDSLLNFETVKYFTNEEFEARRYDSELQTLELARRKNRLSLFGLNGGQALIIAVSQTSMIGLAAWQVRDGTLTLGDFILINQFMIQLFMPLGFLGFVFRELKGSMANIEKMFELLALKPTVTDAPMAPALSVRSGEIVFEELRFAYNPDRDILKGVSFVIRPGQKVAVVGDSGAGKSTLVKMLFRFYDPQGGRILIDGQNIRNVSQASLRRAIGIVPQDTGLKLSGGERQRVSIARTILKRPPILVFDEATSSLDSRSEQAILRALRAISEDHTSLVIAHRLSTIVDADSIVVLHEGAVVEQGTHEALLQAGGHYAELWQAQQKQRGAIMAPLTLPR